MKFKFCANGDCPLWALAALHALGSLPAQLFRALLQQVLDDQPDDEIMELLKDTSLACRDESARAAAAVRWVLRSAWSCGCPAAQLGKDLALLGVPRAHAAALADAADQHRDAYLDSVTTSGFGVNTLCDVSTSAAPAGTLDAYKVTLRAGTGSAAGQTSDLLIDRTTLKELLEQLKAAYAKIQEMESHE